MQGEKILDEIASPTMIGIVEDYAHIFLSQPAMKFEYLSMVGFGAKGRKILQDHRYFIKVELTFPEMQEICCKMRIRHFSSA